MFNPNEQQQKQHVMFLYLFITDLVAIGHGISFSRYEEHEPNYAIPYLNAYVFAFQAPNDGKISHAFIQTIHALATTHLPDSENNQYRQTGKVGFPLHFNHYNQRDVVVLSYNATLVGLKEFIARWFINRESPVHEITFIKRGAKLPVKIEALLTYSGRRIWYNNELYDEGKHIPLIFAMCNNYDFQCSIWSRTPAYKGAIEIQMQIFIDNYHRDIKHAASESQKIVVMARLIQGIDQLHPFQDGNIRTCTIVLNKLLNDHGLALSILMNPNRLDACSIDAIVHMIKDGQKIYQQLINNTNPHELNLTTTDSIEQLKHITCPAHWLEDHASLELFYRAILNTSFISKQPVNHCKDICIAILIALLLLTFLTLIAIQLGKINPSSSLRKAPDSMSFFANKSVNITLSTAHSMGKWLG